MTADALIQGMTEPSFEGDGALETLAIGSRTFAFAGWFLPDDRRADAALLYAFCRFVDDVADESPDPAEARVALARLRAELVGAPPRPLVAALLAMFRRRSIDPAYAVELIVGVESDLGEVIIQDDRALIRYCYRVASTVGLMMCGVLGVRDPRALPHAIDLGVAMQLTNICRDVAEDARRGRVYLPATRLAAAGVSAEPAAVLAAPEGVRAVVADLLALADQYYRSGDAGLPAIPARTRFAIVVASRIYRAIGVRLLRLGGDPLRGRTVVPTWEKLWWASRAAASFVFSLSSRRPAHQAGLHLHLAGLPAANPPDVEASCTA